MTAKKLRLSLIVLISILIVSGFFLFYRLGRADPLTDEIQIAFRSIGWLDFLGTSYQTTPLEWFRPPAPNWVHLSFHDHPPLTFLLEHIIFNFAPDSLFWLRLPFAIFGLATVWLIYLIAKKLFNNNQAALAAALIAATDSYLIWIGRIGLQEGIVIFFSLLALFYLMKAKDNDTNFIYFGLALGLGLLTKYTAAIILPIGLIYIWLNFPEKFKNKKLYLGLLAGLIIFSPVIFYNLQMFKAVGHFDVQLATLFRQAAPQWPVLLGKNIGPLPERIMNFYPALIANSSPVFIFFYFASLIFLIYSLVKKIIRQADFKLEAWLLACLILYHLLIVVIGPSQRFLAMIIPIIILIFAYSLTYFDQKNKILRLTFLPLVILFTAYEAFFSWQTFQTVAPMADSPWVYSNLRNESPALGYNSLEAYLKKTIDVARPAIVFPTGDNLQFINDYRQQDFRRIGKNPKQAILLVFDPRMDNYAKFWIFGRRYYYDGWPIISVDEYLAAKKDDPKFFNEQGFKKFYYFAATENINIGSSPTLSENAESFNDFLDKSKVKPVENLTDAFGKIIIQVFYSEKDFPLSK